MSEKLSKKFIISRKIWVIGSLILIPIVLVIIFVIQGVVNDSIKPELKDEFGVSELNFKKGSEFSDFEFGVEITAYEYASKDGSDGKLSYNYTYKNNTGTKATNISTIMCIGQRSANYVSTVSSSCKESKSSISSSGSTDTGSISNIAYSNKNAFGITKKISHTPDVYIYISYDFEDEDSSTSTKNYVLTYKFNEIFNGYIQTKD